MYKLGAFALHISLFAVAVGATACGSTDPTNELKGAGGQGAETTDTDTETASDELVPLDAAALETLEKSQRQGFVASREPYRRAVLGRPGFLCQDLGELAPGKDQRLVFTWYDTRNGDLRSTTTNFGTCADQARGAVAQVQENRYNAMSGAAIGGRKCATLPDYSSSMWFTIGSGVRTARHFDKTCAWHAANPNVALVELSF